MAEHHPLRTRDQDPRTSSYARHNAEAERRAKECRSARMPDLQHLGLRCVRCQRSFAELHSYALL